MELKERIVEESSNLFFHKGIKSVTMSDIANHMGISKRTLYEIFSDKEELLDECLDRNLRDTDAEMEQLVSVSENVIDAMMRIYAKHLSDLHNINKSVVHDLKKYHPKLYKKIECKHWEDIDTFRPLFENGIRQGLMRNDIQYEILMWLLKAQFKMLMEGDYVPTDKYSMREFVQAIILNFVRGIATPEGNEKIEELIKNIKK